MNITNLPTLQINKLTQAQYDRELLAGRIDENALYLTPDEEVDLDTYAKKDHSHSYNDLEDKPFETETITENRALVSNDSGKVVVSDVTSTEIGYLIGVTSNIQAQLNNKATTDYVNSAIEAAIGAAIAASY